jgi:hypothetical protein
MEVDDNRNNKHSVSQVTANFTSIASSIYPDRRHYSERKEADSRTDDFYVDNDLGEFS